MGTAANAAARTRCANALREAGYAVREIPFEFSEFPGRLATPLMGAATAALVGIAGRLAMQGERVLPLVVLTAGAAAMAAVGAWLSRRGVLDAPVMRARGVNLEATLGRASPAIWLTAHVDSKSQPVPTLLRVAGIVLEIAGFALTFVICVAIALGVVVPTFFWGFAAGVTLLGAIPVVLSMVGDRSPGAMDNASGVTATIIAARQLAGDARVGVLITDAEELGLAGARAWTRGGSRGMALNCDGIDDHGDIQVMYSGARPEALLQRIERASRASGIGCRVDRIIPGVLTDSVAFTDAGMSAVTFSRGSWGSLARIHRPSDDLSHLHGTGIAGVVTLIVASVQAILDAP